MLSGYSENPISHIINYVVIEKVIGFLNWVEIHIKLTILKCAIQWHLVHSQGLCNPHLYLVPEHSPQKKTPCLSAVTRDSALQPLATTNLLFVS